MVERAIDTTTVDRGHDLNGQRWPSRWWTSCKGHDSPTERGIMSDMVLIKREHLLTLMEVFIEADEQIWMGTCRDIPVGERCRYCEAGQAAQTALMETAGARTKTIHHWTRRST